MFLKTVIRCSAMYGVLLHGCNLCVSNLTRLPPRDFHPGTSTRLLWRCCHYRPWLKVEFTSQVSYRLRPQYRLQSPDFFNLRDLLLSSLITHAIAQRGTSLAEFIAVLCQGANCIGSRLAMGEKEKTQEFSFLYEKLMLC
ncbi:hypothetical protein JYQ62_08370 [Nostoc sp. UHCC 0702]|nr:hypothetical protein JYQ62_08370 [Nostoc sp. UHCC 0702]